VSASDGAVDSWVGVEGVGATTELTDPESRSIDGRTRSLREFPKCTGLGLRLLKVNCISLGARDRLSASVGGVGGHGEVDGESPIADKL